MKSKDNLRSVSFVVAGQPYSKANNRKLVLMKGKPRFIKSTPARRYVADFQKQCPRLDSLLEGDLQVEITAFYASRRPDLDVSLILDCCEGFIYKNDRQVKRMLLYWGLDKANPRAEITVNQIEINNPHQPPKRPMGVKGASEEPANNRL